MLTELPDELFSLSSLTDLDLSGNQLTRIPEEIAHLSMLEELDVSDNLLEELPEELAALNHLSSLNLGRNQFKKIPRAVKLMKALTTLNLTANRIALIPSWLGDLAWLHTLNLSQNALTSLSPTIHALRNLQSLDLGRNLLKTIPPEIGELRSLRELTLATNSLTEIPPEIGELKALSDLYLSDNKLSEIPPEFGELRLQVLDLGRNAFEEFPTPVLRLKTLTYLSLSHNRLHDVPLAITNLTKLNEIRLDGNPFSRSRDILAVTTPETLFKRLREQASGHNRRLEETKLILVGEASVGKTSIVNRLVHDAFNPSENTTKEIVITPWSIELGDRTIQINIWDFGGQDIMHATHQFFLTKRSIYVLVLDSRVGERGSRIEYWLKLIRSFGGDSPIIVVCNKADQSPIELNWSHLKNKYGIHAFVRACSCADKPDGPQGIDELRGHLTTAVANLSHVNDLLPDTWFAVKEEIRETKLPYLAYRDFQSIAVQFGVEEHLGQRTLLGYLHDLGVILWFGDDPRLMDTNVIDPTWLTRGVYRILNSNVLFQQKGKAALTQLRDVLGERQYYDKIPFIVDVMKRFELCFSMDCPQGECILIPGLLQRDEPYTGDWSESLQFYIDYDVLPNSIMSRLIVRMNAFAPQNSYWRAGIVLVKDETRALVRADEDEGRISILVHGPKDERRRFLETIRTEFRIIHSTISNISPIELVPVPGTQAVVSYEALLENERYHIREFVPGGMRQPVSVRELLEGVDPPEKLTASIGLITRTFSEQIPDRLFPYLNQLSDALIEQHLAETFEERSALVRGIPGRDSLNRNSNNARMDVDLLLDQLWNRTMQFDDRHPLWRLIDNAVRRLGGQDASYGDAFLELRERMIAVYEEIEGANYL